MFHLHSRGIHQWVHWAHVSSGRESAMPTFLSNSAHSNVARALQFTKDDRACSHDPGTVTVPISSLKVHYGQEDGRLGLCA